MRIKIQVAEKFTLFLRNFKYFTFVDQYAQKREPNTKTGNKFNCTCYSNDCLFILRSQASRMENMRW